MIFVQVVTSAIHAPKIRSFSLWCVRGKWHLPLPSPLSRGTPHFQKPGSENLKRREHLENLGTDGRII
jgi:hypothetical protein